MCHCIRSKSPQDEVHPRNLLEKCSFPIILLMHGKIYLHIKMEWHSDKKLQQLIDIEFRGRKKEINFRKKK